MIGWNRPWLVRQIDNPKVWREATPESKHISKAFTGCYEPISVFRVQTDRQEAEVAAALWLGTGAGLSDPQHLLRIPVEDAEAVGLQQKEISGDTDVRHVDAMHRDLIGDPSRFKALADRIVERSRAGEDTVRTADFLDSGAVGSISIRKAKRELAKADERWPR